MSKDGQTSFLRGRQTCESLCLTTLPCCRQGRGGLDGGKWIIGGYIGILIGGLIDGIRGILTTLYQHF
jgi:hypothetical protein